MKSLIPFNLQSNNKSINKHILGGGLEKGTCLNVYFNDTIGKREITYDMILSAILPKEWSLEDVAGPDAAATSNATQAAVPSESQT